MDAIGPLVQHAVSTTAADLPESTRTWARRAVLDTLGVLIAGAEADGIRPLLEQVREWGGRPEARVLVHGGRVPSPLAAFVNGAMARALDYDDCDEATGDHPSVAAIPAALSAADAAGGVSGADLLAAVALAVDAIMRIRRASPLRLGPRLPWTTATFAPLTGTISAGRALQLDAETLQNAVGLAYTEMSNTMQTSLDGALAHRIHQGAAGQAALTSIALARRGITGALSPLEGKFGLYQSYYHGEYSRALLLDGLGERYLCEEVSVKPFPCCKLTHGAAEAILEIGMPPGLSPEVVDQIEVRVNESAYTLCARQPWHPPQTVVEAQFSIPYVAATALVKGRVALESFTDEGIHDEKVLAAAARVKPLLAPELDSLGLQVAPTEVGLLAADREPLRRRVDFVPGHPRNPMDFAAVANKFRQCATHAKVTAPIVETVVDLVAHLENVPDVRQIIDLLCGSDAV